MSKFHMAVSLFLFVISALTGGFLSGFLFFVFIFSLFSSAVVREWLDYFYAKLRSFIGGV